MIDLNQVGQRILERRKKQGFTQEQLGQELNVSAQAVSKWENGESLPDGAMLPGLCKSLGVSADTLLGIDGEVGLETLSLNLARQIRQLKSTEERNAAILSALSFLNPAREATWNQDRNVSYELDQGRLTTLNYWSTKGLVCFVTGEVLRGEELTPEILSTIGTLVSPTCWAIADKLLDGPLKVDELLGMGIEDSSQPVMDRIQEMVDAGLLVQDHKGYRLGENHGLLLAGMLKALCGDSLRQDGGTGVHVNSPNSRVRSRSRTAA